MNFAERVVKAKGLIQMIILNSFYYLINSKQYIMLTLRRVITILLNPQCKLPACY